MNLFVHADPVKAAIPNRPDAQNTGWRRAVHLASTTTGVPLSQDTFIANEDHVGRNFSHVRIHADAAADHAATALSARAFTIGSDIFFREREFNTQEPAGRRLLSHELAHTLQSTSVSMMEAWKLPVSSPTDDSERAAVQATSQWPNRTASVPRKESAIRRVLAAYSSGHTEILPSMGARSVTSVRSTADSGRLRSALGALIASNKIEVVSVGDRDFFSLPATGAATSSEIIAALTAAGFARPSVVAAAVMDRHNASLFAGEEIQEIHYLWTTEVGRDRNVLRQTDRPLTGEEVAEARLVFGKGLRYGDIRITEDPLLGSLSTARTLPSTIFFPPGSSRRPIFMPWLIHELTHSWQYQHGVGVMLTAGTALVCYVGWPMSYSYGGKAGLLAAAALGRGFNTFNTEQQGDIASDYYLALKSGANTAAWNPFLPELRSPP